ncbi:MAG TPA: rhodanese-like domain-containing protein [Thermoanaerobaculia bacterium]|nr:rhodanese-like domain-containing protein [Thermoanaerobaculia bacterium]
MSGEAAMPEEPVVVSRITAEEAKARVDRGEPIAFVDSRSEKSWSESEVEIPGSVRVPPDHAGEHLSLVPKDRSVVTYCT